jgi:ATP/maltotriose-dependent transcriptional regulator MalT
LLALILQTGTLTDEATRFVRDILGAAAQISGAPQPPTHQELLELTAAASISPREQEILRLVSAGLSNREIAARTCISLSTVKTHLDNIYRKLGVNSRTQAVSEAQILKLV